MKQYPASRIALPNGETLAYRECGQGPAVLLIHGNMSSSVHWQTTMEALEPYFHVIAPDMRGFGDSTYAQPFDSLRELADDLRLLLDALGVDSFDVVGWSAGGGVAMELAADLPDAVRRLVLLESAPATGYPMFKKDAAGVPILGSFLTTKEEVAADPVQVLPALNALRNGDRATMRMLWDMAIYNLRKPPEEDYALYLDGTMQQRCLIDLDYALLTFNITHRSNGAVEGSGRIGSIRCPVTVIHGARDLVVPEAWARQLHADFGERAQFVLLPEASHSPITDHPEGFFEVLRGALGIH